MTRTFNDVAATRRSVPLLVGLVGPSSSGKTFSALRLASGMQTVTGGEIFVIDTEADRALHYADRFRFRHVQFKAPFSPSDYLAAIEHCVKHGAKVIVIDSMSHEHEGPGGVLEMHAAAVQKMSKGDQGKAERVKLLAWSEPKQQRRRLLNTMVQLGCSVICCFRAKEKLKVVTGKDPQQQGWMLIGGDEFGYEMTASFLLEPGSGGCPTFVTDNPGEKTMIKIPAQFAWLRELKGPLSEEVGAKMAEWAAGDAAPKARDWSAEIRDASTASELETIGAEIRAAAEKGALKAKQATALKSEYGQRLSALRDPPLEREPGDDEPDDGAAP